MVINKRILCFKHEKEFILEQAKLSLFALKKFIDSSVEDINNWIKEEKENMINSSPNKPLRDLTEEEFQELFLYGTNVLEYQLSESFVLSLYGILEDSLNKLCKLYERTIENNKKIKDFKKPKSSKLKQFNDYLKYIGVNNVDVNIYTNLNLWRIVRNNIIHNGGCVSEKEAEKIKYIVNIDTIAAPLYYSFGVNYQMVKNFIETIEEYFKYVFEQEIPNMKFKKN